MDDDGSCDCMVVEHAWTNLRNRRFAHARKNKRSYLSTLCPQLCQAYRSKDIFCPQFVHKQLRQKVEFDHNLTTTPWFVHHLSTSTINRRNGFSPQFVHKNPFVHYLSTHTFQKRFRTHHGDLTCVSLQPAPHLYQLSYCCCFLSVS